MFVFLQVIWPNRGGGFGISEIVDVVSLETEEARLYHEPEVVDNNIFFPMNWTFHLSCDRIRSNDCIFNPIRRAPSRLDRQRVLDSFDLFQNASPNVLLTCRDFESNKD